MVAALYLFSVYNALVRVRDRTRKSWANVGAELQRRYDLLPNLVAVVAASAEHERATLVAVLDARTGKGSWGHVDGVHGDADVQAATQAVLAQTASFRQALAVAENYPQLKTSAAFQDLCRQIIDTESRLALTRQFFNEAVEALRNRLGQFPGVLFDRGARFPAGELFIANEFDRVVPRVAEAGQ